MTSIDTKEMRKEILKWVMPLFHDVEKLQTCDILLAKDSFVGPTDYIDSIKVSDVYAPLMIGRDKYKRSFITLRMKFTCIKKSGRFKPGDETMVVNAYFQRYSNEYLPWVVGTCYGSDLRIAEVCPDAASTQTIKSIITNGYIETDDFKIELC